jgi:hypothetical protein
MNNQSLKKLTCDKLIKKFLPKIKTIKDLVKKINYSIYNINQIFIKYKILTRNKIKKLLHNPENYNAIEFYEKIIFDIKNIVQQILLNNITTKYSESDILKLIYEAIQYTSNNNIPFKPSHKTINFNYSTSKMLLFIQKFVKINFEIEDDNKLEKITYKIYNIKLQYYIIISLYIKIYYKINKYDNNFITVCEFNKIIDTIKSLKVNYNISFYNDILFDPKILFNLIYIYHLNDINNNNAEELITLFDKIIMIYNNIIANLNEFKYIINIINNYYKLFNFFIINPKYTKNDDIIKLKLIFSSFINLLNITNIALYSNSFSLKKNDYLNELDLEKYKLQRLFTIIDNTDEELCNRFFRNLNWDIKFNFNPVLYGGSYIKLNNMIGGVNEQIVIKYFNMYYTNSEYINNRLSQLNYKKESIPDKSIPDIDKQFYTQINNVYIFLLKKYINNLNTDYNSIKDKIPDVLLIEKNNYKNMIELFNTQLSDIQLSDIQLSDIQFSNIVNSMTIRNIITEFFKWVNSIEHTNDIHKKDLINKYIILYHNYILFNFYCNKIKNYDNEQFKSLFTNKLFLNNIQNENFYCKFLYLIQYYYIILDKIISLSLKLKYKFIIFLKEEDYNKIQYIEDVNNIYYKEIYNNYIINKYYLNIKDIVIQNYELYHFNIIGDNFNNLLLNMGLLEKILYDILNNLPINSNNDDYTINILIGEIYGQLHQNNSNDIINNESLYIWNWNINDINYIKIDNDISNDKELDILNDDFYFSKKIKIIHSKEKINLIIKEIIMNLINKIKEINNKRMIQNRIKSFINALNYNLSNLFYLIIIKYKKINIKKILFIEVNNIQTNIEYNTNIYTNIDKSIDYYKFIAYKFLLDNYYNILIEYKDYIKYLIIILSFLFNNKFFIYKLEFINEFIDEKIDKNIQKLIDILDTYDFSNIISLNIKYLEQKIIISKNKINKLKKLYIYYIINNINESDIDYITFINNNIDKVLQINNNDNDNDNNLIRQFYKSLYIVLSILKVDFFNIDLFINTIYKYLLKFADDNQKKQIINIINIENKIINNINIINYDQYIKILKSSLLNKSTTNVFNTYISDKKLNNIDKISEKCYLNYLINTTFENNYKSYISTNINTYVNKENRLQPMQAVNIAYRQQSENYNLWFRLLLNFKNAAYTIIDCIDSINELEQKGYNKIFNSTHMYDMATSISSNNLNQLQEQQLQSPSQYRKQQPQKQQALQHPQPPSQQPPRPPSHQPPSRLHPQPPSLQPPSRLHPQPPSHQPPLLQLRPRPPSQLWLNDNLNNNLLDPKDPVDPHGAFHKNSVSSTDNSNRAKKSDSRPLVSQEHHHTGAATSSTAPQQALIKAPSPRLDTQRHHQPAEVIQTPSSNSLNTQQPLHVIVPEISKTGALQNIRQHNPNKKNLDDHHIASGTSSDSIIAREPIRPKNHSQPVTPDPQFSLTKIAVKSHNNSVQKIGSPITDLPVKLLSPPPQYKSENMKPSVLRSDPLIKTSLVSALNLSSPNPPPRPPDVLERQGPGTKMLFNLAVVGDPKLEPNPKKSIPIVPNVPIKPIDKQNDIPSQANNEAENI